ncbi:hypothetical protein STSV1pORF11 [Sulfolobus virus STSV1]|uniref:hypothetical protein n=1 Tax=Sulfolobus virus STSV1 TaxID=285013 RepID=UPI000042B0F9|nr:hypothetical protein STSV1pORF11 [Sulfolobus virus STSV1]CAH04194.1 hypothetical protein [Sulfolobus virus STSV1]
MSQPLNQTPTQGANQDKLKEKIGKYIKDLEDLKLGYDINDIQEEIVESYSITKGVKEALKVTYAILTDYYNDAKEKSKLLSDAYNKNAIKSMFDNAIELYADLAAINALLRLMRSFKIEPEPTLTTPLFIDFASKAKDTVILLIGRYVKDVKKDDRRTIINKISKELSWTISYQNKLESDFKAYEEEFEEKDDISAGEYKVLKRALKLIKYYYWFGIRLAKETKAMIKRDGKNVNMRKIAWKLTETYATMTISFALHDILCSDKYDVCYKWFNYILLFPTEDVKDAIEVIREHALRD